MTFARRFRHEDLGVGLTGLQKARTLRDRWLNAATAARPASVLTTEDSRGCLNSRVMQCCVDKLGCGCSVLLETSPATAAAIWGRALGNNPKKRRRLSQRRLRQQSPRRRRRRFWRVRPRLLRAPRQIARNCRQRARWRRWRRWRRCRRWPSKSWFQQHRSTGSLARGTRTSDTPLAAACVTASATCTPTAGGTRFLAAVVAVIG